jgi:putative transposase
MDVFSRYIVGWSVSNTMETSWIIQTLHKAVKQNGMPENINSDQDSQFTSKE